MSDNCILIDDNLYEIHCIMCDDILGILEVDILHNQPYLCETCGNNINSIEAAEQEINRGINT